MKHDLWIRIRLPLWAWSLVGIAGGICATALGVGLGQIAVAFLRHTPFWP